MPAIDLRGRPIAITGASSGIGAATARACARAGMPVALAARRTDKLAAIVDEIVRAGGRAIAVPCDVVDPAQCRALIDRTVEAFGSLYAVYANAGYGVERAAADMPDADVRAMFETNFFGSLNVIRPAVERMRASAGTGGSRGHVLWCSSCVAKIALPYYGVYSATKAAQNHLGRAMRLELEPEGIHVSTVHPIGTRTEFFDRVVDLSGSAKLIEHTPDALLQSPEYVADLTVRCLRRPRAEVWTGPKGAFVRFGMSVCTFAPGLADFVLRGQVRRRLSAAAERDRRSDASTPATPAPR
jgi:short-subunit dehydrogenase